MPNARSSQENAVSAVPIPGPGSTFVQNQEVSSAVSSAGGIDRSPDAGEVNRNASPRGGRPRLSKSKQRRHKYTVSLNDQEKEAIERKAELLGLPARVYMREVSLGMRMSVKGRGEVIHQLSRIGVNVNQMAKRLNANAGAPELETLQDILAEVRAIRNEL